VSIDWGEGRYENTAAQLAPIAEVVVEAAAPQPGERVLDLGTGTGNAALLAAARHASVLGVDPAARLLEVARERAADAGLDAAFELGEGAAIPVEDAGVDVLISVFGVIFAPDPAAAAVEMARVTAPDGRIVLSAWVPGGAVSEVVRMARGTTMQALGAPPAPPPFAWHEQEALAGLLGGFDVSLQRHDHVFTAPSIDAFIQRELVDHPMAAAMPVGADVQAEIVARAREILTAANEATERLAVTSSYVVATARRPPGRPRPR
jgi:SAM-dependent methyltransferase